MNAVGLPEQTGDGVAVTGHRLPPFISHLWNSNYTPQGLIRGLGPLGKTLLLLMMARFNLILSCPQALDLP